jgi:hypothetical protein
MKLHEGFIEQHTAHQCVNQICDDGIATLKNITKVWKHNKLSCVKIKQITADGHTLAELMQLLTDINNQIINSLNESIANVPFSPLVE